MKQRKGGNRFGDRISFIILENFLRKMLFDHISVLQFFSFLLTSCCAKLIVADMQMFLSFQDMNDARVRRNCKNMEKPCGNVIENTWGIESIILNSAAPFVSVPTLMSYRRLQTAFRLSWGNSFWLT